MRDAMLAVLEDRPEGLVELRGVLTFGPRAKAIAASYRAQQAAVK
jgi:hypothetical protein